MLPILLKTLPFFGLAGLGYLAGQMRFFTAEATAALTKFVFYFALSAMLFRFAATLSLGEVFSWSFVFAYLTASFAVYLLVFCVAILRGVSLPEATVEAQCAVVGNVGFLGVPMLVLLMGQQAAGPVLLVLAIDLIVFSSLITILMTLNREGRMRWGVAGALVSGLARNPMIVSMVAGLIWGATGLSLWAPIDEFLSLLGAAATPGAMFAIGASLAGRTAERIEVAGWLALAKLFLHPGAVALAALTLFSVEPGAAAVMIAAASLPVAGNVYILAAHYGVAPQRVSTSILMSTGASILTVSAIIAMVTGGTS